MASVEHILIVGGGLAGLALAHGLQQQGFTPELVERNASWETVGAGIFLHANAMRVLRSLGLDAEVERAGTVIRRWAFYGQSGERLSETDLAEVWDGLGPCVGIARPALHKVLLAAAGTTRARLGMAVTSLVQADEQVRVGFSDGSSAVYDLVVGADGIQSTVRQLTWDGVPVGYTGVMCWRGIVPMRPAGVSGWTGVFGDGVVFGLVPLGDGHTYGFAFAGGPQIHDPLEGRLARIRERFAALRGPVPAYLAALTRDEDLHCAPIEWVEMPEWHSGHVVVIGDAAHAGPPTMAQGGAMALEDAYVLADVLGAETSVESALRVYASRRGPRVRWVEEQSRAMAAMFRTDYATFTAMFRERADAQMRALYRPLIPAP
ncbi:MAG TPA: FAD-binding monooxygenase [Chloroflexi bacterium]|jgi:2-polyprenyl-6-methoxyphenol hydroxylase-like FAD-dependent oxidoreductase|nr:FAD-binding monooxygenase [Chloroflexota bacterium]HAL25594.1 FAD-binding monooxygenase [Chloroflexota bacterium]